MSKPQDTLNKKIESLLSKSFSTSYDEVVGSDKIENLFDLTRIIHVKSWKMMKTKGFIRVNPDFYKIFHSSILG